jgi:hypothetical protein
MSLHSWKKEFYPKGAHSAEAKADPIGHSLRKWTGLLPKNLAKHGLKVENLLQLIRDDTDHLFRITGSSCALCAVYFKTTKNDPCQACPLYKALGNVACDAPHKPYRKWHITGDPRPMIRALRRAQKQAKA